MWYKWPPCWLLPPHTGASPRQYRRTELRDAAVCTVHCQWPLCRTLPRIGTSPRPDGHCKLRHAAVFPPILWIDLLVSPCFFAHVPHHVEIVHSSCDMQQCVPLPVSGLLVGPLSDTGTSPCRSSQQKLRYAAVFPPILRPLPPRTGASTRRTGPPQLRDATVCAHSCQWPPCWPLPPRTGSTSRCN